MDVLITIPTLLVLVVVASAIRTSMSTTIMAITIALLAWREPTRQIRAQVLVMREAQYVKVALLNGAGSLRVIFREMMPNLLPFLAASLVMAVAQAVLASIGLEALGLGTPSEPTLGMTIFWMMNKSAFMLGLWWWIVAPITVLVVLFVGLFLVTAGLDEIANPRLRRADRMSAGLQVRDLTVNYHTDAGHRSRGRWRQLRRGARRAARRGRRIRLRQDDDGARADADAAAARPLRRRHGARWSTASICWRCRRRRCAGIGCAPSATSRRAR